ncbi:MAG TPA: putative capsular polysaccharide synthesis family protein [Patescibacteria group bacterium]|nr:putative capsular polysaccharide synthesis family protein [Patescibacteria group bacterium]
MPKTGSQTVEASLEQCSLPHRILRCHFLSARRRAELRQVLRSPNHQSAWKDQLGEQLNLMARISMVLRLRNLLRLCHINLPKLEIITAVREPISLGLSSIFQNHLYFVPRPEELTLELCSEVLQRPKMFTSLDNWFDFELKPLTGIDVYNTPFRFENGCAIYENSRARVLLYRFEDIQNLKGMIAGFLGCCPQSIVAKNLSQAKCYSARYEHARQHLRLPHEFVLRRYMSKLACHFYSPHELAEFVRRWTVREPALRPDAK